MADEKQKEQKTNPPVKQSSYGNALMADATKQDGFSQGMDAIGAMGDRLMDYAIMRNAQTKERRDAMGAARKEDRQEMRELRKSGATREERKAARKEKRGERKKLKKELLKQENERIAKQKEQDKLLDAISRSCQNFANQGIDQEGALNESHYKAAEPFIKELADTYYKNIDNPDTEEAGAGMMDLNTLSTVTQKQKELNNDFSTMWTDGSMSERALKDPEFMKKSHAFFSPNTERKVLKNEDGSMDYAVKYEDGWITSDDFDKMLNNYTVDTKAQVSFNDAQQEIMKAARNIDIGIGEDVPEPDMNSIGEKVNALVKDGNMYSMMNDPMLGGTQSFKDHLAEHPDLKNLGADLRTMELGIEADENEEHWSDNLTENDVNMLIDALTNPDNENYDADASKGLLTSYFTQNLYNNYKNTVEKKRNENMTEQAEKIEIDGQSYVRTSDGTMAPISEKEERFKDMTTEELLSMYNIK